MTDEAAINPDEPVRHVIVSLLLTALPPELQAAAPELAGRVGEHPEVAPHFGKRWGEVTEAQGNIIAREVGLVARDVIAGAGAVVARFAAGTASCAGRAALVRLHPPVTDRPTAAR
jgi:hypothetical protein